MLFKKRFFECRDKNKSTIIIRYKYIRHIETDFTEEKYTIRIYTDVPRWIGWTFETKEDALKMLEDLRKHLR